MRRYPGIWLLCIATVLIQIPAQAYINEFVISDDSPTNVKMHYMGYEHFLVVAERMNKPIFAFGAKMGEEWEIIEQPWPGGLLPGYAFNGLAWSHRAFVGYGGTGVASANLKEMPVWFSDGRTGWCESRLQNPDPATSYREIDEMVMGSADGMTLYASGYEIVGGQFQGRLWRSTDMTLNWEAVPVPRLAPPAVVHVVDVSPDYTVWGIASQHVVRIDPDHSVETITVAVQNCYEISGLSAPTDRDVFVCWRRGPNRENLESVISHSNDRGKTWTHVTTAMSPNSRVLISFLDESFGMVAVEEAEAWADYGWDLHITKNRMASWETPTRLAGYNLLGLEVLSRRYATMIARKASPKWLYCLIWQSDDPANNPPTAPTVTIVPANPKSSDTLQCRATGSTDPDGDTVAYRFQWIKNGGIQPDNTARRLNSKNTQPGDEWTCVVTPTDGEDDGLTGEATVTIR